jgi:entericidin B
MMRTLSAILLATWFLAGCNTMAGAGKDIERGGEKIQGSAERNK